jgi:hypothetical protein
MAAGIFCSILTTTAVISAQQQQSDSAASNARETKKAVAQRHSAGVAIKHADDLARALKMNKQDRRSGALAGKRSEARRVKIESAPAPAMKKEFERRCNSDPALGAAVADLLDQQVDSKHADPARFEMARALVMNLGDSDVPARRNRLRRIYEEGYRAADKVQLQENEQLGRLIHAALARHGEVDQPDYSRSPAYKRILRRRIYLEAHPEAQKP